MKILFSLAICTSAWAQIDRPQLGKMLDQYGAVRTLYGIASSVSLGDPEMTGVLSSACSKTFCLAKTETSVGAASAPPGPALFAFDGSAAFVWFQQSRQLAQWTDGALTTIDTAVDGEVLSIRVRTGAVEFAVRRTAGIWIVKADGSAVDALPSSAIRMIFIADGAVYATREEVIVHDVRFPLKHVTALSQISPAYLQVRAAGIEYALRVEKGQETLFQLPGVPQ